MNLERARADVEQIFRDVIRSVDPERLVRDALSVDGDAVIVNEVRHEVGHDGRLVLLGVGKSAIGMARGVEQVLGDRLDHGLIVTKRGLAIANPRLARTQVLEASHPVPDESSVVAGRRLLEEASKLAESDLALVVVSGGGSALVEAPVQGLTLDDFKRTTAALLRGGADIWTLNAVRRRLSQIKAGGLARVIAPARVVNLVLSDVLGSPLGVIASGLSVEAVEDDVSRIDAIRASSVWAELPESVRALLNTSEGASRTRASNVVQSVIVGDATLAARAAGYAARNLGYHPFLVGTAFAGDAREFGRTWAQLARSIAAGNADFDTPACIVGAGEMTVTVRGDGSGGRNTEMVATAAIEIAGTTQIAVASLASDGDDGTSHAAGGVVTGNTVPHLVQTGVNPMTLLDRNDTRRLLELSGGLIVTGQTGTNVNDLYLALVGDPPGGSSN